jgi:hydroxymethylbilane synthase
MSTLQAGKTITIGTRGSKLSLVQAELVRSALLAFYPDVRLHVRTITTRGDAVQDRPLSEIGGSGLFVKQIEEALRDGYIDIAVHSAKDLPSVLPAGMVIAAYLPRADARDVLVSRTGAGLMDLPAGARVGTSSPRRACLLASLRPDLTLIDIRGNVDTRLRKLFDGQYDAVVLAAAGLERLGMLDRVTEWLDPDVFVPAVGQGALAVEVRADDSEVRALVGALDDPATSTCIRAERAFLAYVGGGCSLPVAAYARLDGGSVHLTGLIGGPHGRLVRGGRTGPATSPEEQGTALADELLARGGRAFVQAAAERA